MSRNRATIGLQNGQPGVQKHCLGVVNDSPNRRGEIYPQTTEFRKSENPTKNNTIKDDLGPNQAFLQSTPQDLSWCMRQTIKEMNVLTAGFGDQSVKFKAMID